MVSSQLICADSVVAMKDMADNSVDSIVTDPPYGLEFMGKDWDAPWKKAPAQPGDETFHTTDTPAGRSRVRYGLSSGYGGDLQKKMVAFQEWTYLWAKEAFRVLKPGGHILSFAGSRTYHRVASAIEDAGFEVRDQIMWLYGSGFPKSLNVGKAIDKAAGVEREVIGENPNIVGRTTKGNTETDYGGFTKNNAVTTTPTTPEAKQWEGWGTALKPAHEPIVVARKPIESTVAENVLEHGTGAINIDGTRIGHNEPIKTATRKQRKAGWNTENCGFDSTNNDTASANPKGRFPANVILTHHPECIRSGHREVKSSGRGAVIKESAKGYQPNAFGKESRGKGTEMISYNDGSGKEIIEDWKCHSDCPLRILDEQSGASRFFYCAKTSQAERNAGCDHLPNHDAKAAYGNRVCSTCGKHELQSDMNRRCVCDKPTWDSGRLKPVKNLHPTVKPVDLMRYLCRLVTPPEGIVLDPFMGSGTTGIAANLEQFNFIGIDMEEEYVEIARARIAHSGEYVITEDLTMKRIKQPTLFDYFEEE